MSPLLVFFVLSQQTGTISFSTPGAPFDGVCDLLTKQTGLTIVPAGDLRDEVVALDIHEMPRQELVKRLAHILYATVALKDDKWEFKGDPAAATKRQRDALATRIANIKHAQAGVLAEVESEGEFDANKLVSRLKDYSKQFEQSTKNLANSYQAFELIRRDGPGCRAVRRLVAHLPADVLAEMPGGDVLVFSDQPHRYQMRLGEEAAECIAEAAAEQNAWASAYQSDGSFESRGWWYSGDPRSSLERIDPTKVRLFLKATMDADSNLPRFEAHFVTADGIVLLSTNSDMRVDVKPEIPAPTAAPTGEADMSLTPLSKDQVVAYRKGPYTYVEGAQGAPREWILNPEKFEPLGGAVSEALIVSAQARHKNLVACIPDEAFNLMYTFGGDTGQMWPFKPSGVLATIAKMSAQVEEDDTCIEIRGNGTDPRQDRATLGRFIRQENQDGCLRLLPLVKFAGLLKTNEWNSVAWQAVDPIVPNSLEMAQIPEWLPLRLLGHLSPEQISALVSGRTLRIDSLPEYVVEGIQHAVFFRDARNINYPYIPRRNTGRHSTLDREPTEIMPDGIWRDATVSLKSTTSFAMAAVTNDHRAIPMSMNEYAIHNLAQQSDDFKGRDPWRGDPTPTVHLGHRTQYILQWQLSPQISMTHTLNDNDFNLTSEPISANALPDSYQKELVAEIANLQKQASQIYRNPTRGGNPPPPPR